MTDYIYALMTDKAHGIIAGIFKGILYMSSLCYGAAIASRKLLYRFGIFKKHTVPMKVISVGNITLGGTGKTPFVITLARLVKEELKKEVSVLTRGYGWDEQAMLKKSLFEIPVFVGEDRVRSCRRTLRLYGSDAVILDDGFQYWELERDLDIVLVDSRNPFGNGMLFPRGILREALSSLERADVVIFTKVNKKRSDIGAIKEKLRAIKGDLVFLEAVHRPKAIYDLRLKKDFELAYLKGKRAILLSSIGDPGYFEETVKDLGADVIDHIIFADHHNYSAGDIGGIKRRCDERKFDLLITTEKDAVKLNRLALSIGDYNIVTLAVSMEIIKGKEELIDRLHSLYID